MKVSEASLMVAFGLFFAVGCKSFLLGQPTIMERRRVLVGEGPTQHVPRLQRHIVNVIQRVEMEEERENNEIEIPSLSMEDLLLPKPDCDVNQLGPTAMAYIGDVVFELFVRSRMIWPARKTADLQNQVVSFVRAEYQAKLLVLVMDRFPLTQKEQSIVTRGRNSGSVKGNKRKPVDYANATGFEALLGYLYITDRARCEEFLNFLYAYLDKADDFIRPT